MKSIISIVGRPNVGKSTLFNILTGGKSSAVFDVHGLTRDRHYGLIHFKNESSIIVDTGGITNLNTKRDILTLEQTVIAIKESNLIYFVVDSHSGLTPDDEYVAKLIREYQKDIFLIVNKIDGFAGDLAYTDFYRLGFEKLNFISSTTKEGVDKLLCDTFSHNFKTMKTFKHIESNEIQKQGILFALVGHPNVGKSTLINHLVGSRRVMVSDQPGTTINSISVHFKALNGCDYTVVDTAGMRRRSKVSDPVEKFSFFETLKVIRMVTVVVLIIDINIGVTKHDLHLIKLIFEIGKSIIIVFNKTDTVTNSFKKKSIKEQIRRDLLFLKYNIPILPFLDLPG